jgi:hypothetical protein
MCATFALPSAELSKASLLELGAKEVLQAVTKAKGGDPQAKDAARSALASLDVA